MAELKYAELLAQFNPWWNDPDAINADEHVRAWVASKARYVPSLFQDLRSSLGDEGRIIYTVRGSRQVGKTTLVKLLVRDLLGQGKHPSSICYFSLDSSIAAMDLVQVLRDYNNLVRSARGNGRSYIFIDEISMAMGWQNAILSLSNMGVLSNSALVVTGSNAIDLTRGTEGIVGRKGMLEGGSHRSLLPMAFLDYACLENPPLRKYLERNLALTKESRFVLWKNIIEGKESDAINALLVLSGDLNVSLHKYLLSGGIPRAVNQYLETRSIPDPYYIDYFEGIRHEWNKMKYGVDHLTDCMEFFIKGTGGTITWNGMAKKIDVSNYTVAANYATTTHDMYLTLITYFYDEHRDKAAKNKLKKVHLRDPFFFHTFNAVAQNEGYFRRALKYVSDRANFGHLVECTVADHLARHAISSSTDKSQINVSARLFHWRDSASREVDFVYRDPDCAPVPIEVKCTGHVNRRRLGGMSAFLDATPARRGIVATLAEYGVERDYTLVPASLLLLLLS